MNRLKSYSVERLEGRQEDVDADHEDLSEMQKDFPIESIMVQASVEEAILDDVVLVSKGIFLFK